jgi:PhnB protein
MTNQENLKALVPIPGSISPWLSVSDGAKAVEFYRAAFGAIQTYRLDAPDGGVVAKLSVDGAEFWLSGEAPGNTAPPPKAESSIRMILTVTDPDTMFARALNAGATEIFPVGEGHGWRLGRLEDPFGYHWEIGRPLDE